MKAKKIRGTMTRTRRVGALVVFVTCLMSSCEVVRTISNISEYKQVDDKNVIIETRTVESYVGSKSNTNQVEK